MATKIESLFKHLHFGFVIVLMSSSFTRKLEYKRWQLIGI